MKFITKADLLAWLDITAWEKNVIAPRRVANNVLYQPIENSSQIAWDYIRPDLPLKEAFFPPTERLFMMKSNGQQVKLIESLPEEEKIIFGVRSCDALGVQLLDELFLEDIPPDPYYAKRRENTTLIGLACSQIGADCFCTQVGGAPDDPRGLDLMFKEVEDGYILQVLSEKGQQIYESLPKVSEYYGKMPDRPKGAPLFIGAPESIDWEAHFDDEYWMDLSERCLGCRICAYVCPTCRCFDVRDEPIAGQPGAFERLRSWDSCVRENYRQIAGGHNPRAQKAERLRNRFYCKFFYYPQQYHTSMTVACTGCGRCIEACPVNIDISEIISHLLEVAR